MPLRPIDVVLIDPKERYYVVYQNGELYQLTRMKLDIKSWQRRTPFTGNTETIVVSSNQNIADPQLRNILNTQALPSSLHGRNLPFFEGWWKSNGFQWSQNNANQSKREQAELKQDNKNTAVASSVTTSPSSQQKKQGSTKSQVVVDSATDLKSEAKVKSNIMGKKITTEVNDDFFDNLLSELNC